MSDHTAPAGGSTLSSLGRAALAALQAAEIVAIDRRHGGFDIVIDETAGEREPGALSRLVASLSPELTANEIVVTTFGPGSTILSCHLSADAGTAIGEFHVLYSDRAAPPDTNRLSTLVRAFVRHVSLALEHDDLRRRSVQITATLEGMTALDELVTAQDALAEITPRVASIVRPLIGAEKVGITVWNPDTSTLHSLPGAFGAPVSDIDSMRGTVKDLRSITARVLTTSLPYMSNHAEGDPGILQSYVKLFRLRRIVSLPLIVGDRCIGVLHLANKHTDFTADDTDVVMRLTPRIATVIELSTVVQTLASRQRHEAVLAEAALALAGGAEFRQTVQPALEKFGRLAEASVVALVAEHACPLLWRDDDTITDLDARFFADARAADFGPAGSHPAGAGDSGWAAIHVPVDLHGRPLATLSALRRRGQPFTTYEATVLRRLASLSSLASMSESLREQQDHLARLQERQRIADDLHDRVAQVFFVAVLGLDSLLEEPDQTPTERVRLTEVREVLVKGDTFIRETIRRLSPPQEALDERLRLMVTDVREDFGVPVELRIGEPGPDPFADVPGTLADAALRITREATVNAAKHASAHRVEVEVGLEAAAVVLTVLDDGVGLPSAPGNDTSYGMRSMLRVADEAGGSVEFLPGPYSVGTLVRARLPLDVT